MKKIITILVMMISISPMADAQEYSPVIGYESMLDTFMNPNTGLVSFTEFNVGFAPEPPFNAQVALVDSEGNVMQSFAFRPDYRWREGVFAKAQVVGPADITLTESGVYNIAFVINGEVASRLPFRFTSESDDSDPFNPGNSYKIDGLWRKFAHITMKPSGERTLPEVTLWLGSPDIAGGNNSGQADVELIREGEVVAQSKIHNPAMIRPGHFKRETVTLFVAHDSSASVNAEFYTKNDMTDGEYVLQLTRRSDGQIIRSYDFTVSGGEIEPMPQTELGFEPQADYMMPRVTKKGSTTFEFVETNWIQDRDM